MGGLLPQNSPENRKLQLLMMNRAFNIQLIDKVQRIIRYTFKNPDLLRNALRAPSPPQFNLEKSSLTQSTIDNVSQTWDGNRRLAFLGDAVLRVALAEEWYPTKASREQAFSMIAISASNGHLARIGTSTGLHKCICFNPAIFKDGVPSVYTIATTVEAILGAVYLESGISAVRDVMQTLAVRPQVIRKVYRDGPASPFQSRPAVTDEHQALHIDLRNKAGTSFNVAPDRTSRKWGKMKSHNGIGQANRQHQSLHTEGISTDTHAESESEAIA